METSNPGVVFLTVAELAARWGIHELTVRRLIDNGTVKSVKIGEKSIRVALSEVERYENRKAEEK
jgi:excisionase family DNA binding protein